MLFIENIVNFLKINYEISYVIHRIKNGYLLWIVLWLKLITCKVNLSGNLY